jgi:hypothetical protein
VPASVRVSFGCVMTKCVAWGKCRALEDTLSMLCSLSEAVRRGEAGKWLYWSESKWSLEVIKPRLRMVNTDGGAAIYEALSALPSASLVDALNILCAIRRLFMLRNSLPQMRLYDRGQKRVGMRKERANKMDGVSRQSSAIARQHFNINPPEQRGSIVVCGNLELSLRELPYKCF